MGEGKIKQLLSYFTKHRLLNTTEKRKQKYYQINRFSPAFEELVKIFEQSEKNKNRDFLEKTLLSAGNIRFAALTGIFVGLPKNEVDLLLVGKTSPTKLNDCIKFLEKLISNEINYVEMSTREFKDRFYGFDWFMKEIMDNNPVIIIDEVTKKLEK
ncbi:MAG: hypothetical protein COT91_04210 [Candidatus Doudnabacteria bacterium CG10_big_fil_rev_8_21_14_0_10_41_10]|uniref:Polymerase nucleotidyl transferase domain-containing protein n=1 Tax=Candidatus Doudnabacteria bacterium CG10_big_fil_rev_8_21_14_0_10_41_10 TaxID=1974551 RepID=A0A2H0VCU0_9BACT|nr:MAG: hypothetical protein COT91_04210 [Candidatus Doudnabacteria bacterium CG10_big_fil_rev_8_21_14_0_10_41_10]